MTSALASLVGIPVGIASSAIAIEISLIISGIKKYKPVVKKKKKKHDKIELVTKSWTPSNFLTSKALIDWDISHDEVVSLLTLNLLDEINN